MLTGVILAVSLVMAGAPASVAAHAACESSLASAGLCGSNNGSSVTVTDTRPAAQNPTAARPQAPGGSGNPGSSGRPGTSAPVDTGPSEYEICQADRGRPRACMQPNRPDVEPRPADAVEAAPAAPTIAITDLVDLAPATATATGDPSNLGVAGLPTNFVAATSVHTRTGTLFGAPITARFTPVGFDFAYGDGTTASTTTGGATWAQLGQAQFTPTATSHVYRDRGTYDASVTVRYTAEIDIGTGWIPIAGHLAIPGPTQPIRIFEAHTALVQHTCAERPTAPGC